MKPGGSGRGLDGNYPEMSFPCSLAGPIQLELLVNVLQLKRWPVSGAVVMAAAVAMEQSWKI